MMRIIKATKSHAKEISRWMLSDLENPSPKFPKEMINRFREHAQEKGILMEFENPKLNAFVAIDKTKVVGFIVGYEEDSGKAMIHYVAAQKYEMKERLLNRFIKECKLKNMNKIITDAFEFRDNNEFFKSMGFVFTRKELIAKDLEMLWYEIKI
ncbi:MAG: hypothetical protein QME12_05945 [Nanoarchaeota archaeon]|nr:hypothetical protein [Nanoarchaeota archaeon]